MTKKDYIAIAEAIKQTKDWLNVGQLSKLSLKTSLQN
jgi:hypothetical protein